MKIRSSSFILAFTLACRGSAPEEPAPGGARLDVLFDERHGLQGGEPVRLHDFEVGRVTGVDLAEARVRATIDIGPDVLEQLTKETTVSIEEGDSGLYLLVHVLDPDAEKLSEGATLEGVDSSIELTLRQAGSGASKLLDRVGSSEWVEDAKAMFADVQAKLEEVDWGEREKEVRDRLDEAKGDLEDAAGKTAEDARESYRAVREQMKKIVEELRRLGRSEEAQRLEDRIDELFGENDEQGTESRGR